jgi:hypothetical protein
MTPCKEMDILIGAAIEWTRENPPFSVRFEVVHVNDYVTGSNLLVEHKRSRANISCARPTNADHALHESQKLLWALKEAKTLLVMGYGAPCDGARLDPVWERGQ